MHANELLAEIQRLYAQLRANPSFGYSNGRLNTPAVVAEAGRLEDQIRSLSDRYKRLTAPPTDDRENEDARVADTQYQAASP
jgi:hypothetical protein